MRSNQLWCTVAITLAMLAAPATAGAAWRTETIPGTAGASPPGSFAFDRQGRGLIVFEAFDQQRSPSRLTGQALRAPTGGWTRLADIRGIGWGSAAVHPYARSRALLITREVTGFGRFNRARFRLVWALGRTDGDYGAFRQIDASADVPASAANPSGDALVAYTPQGAAGVRVSERAAGHGFGRPRSVSGPRAVSPAVAINPRGDRVVAWYDGERVQARLRRADGDWGPTRTVARIAGRGANAPLRALVTANGRAVLAWETAAVRESQPPRIEAGVAIRPSGGDWRSALLERSVLETQTDTGAAGAIPVVDTSGNVLVAWTGRWRQATGVRIAGVSASARITATTLVSGETQAATLDDLAAGPQDRLALTYAEQLGNSAVATWAALRPTAGVFGPGEAVSSPLETALVGSRVAFSPLSGEPTIVRPLISGARGALVASVPDATG